MNHSSTLEQFYELFSEGVMTTKNKKKEKRLKKKYDSSGMKASMIKQYGPEKGKQVYFATIRKQAMESFDLEEAKLSRTERRARAATKKPRGSAVHAYDMDETLVGHDHSKVKVHVNDPSGKRVHSLTNQEFNTHKLPKDHSYDFGEFRSSKVFQQSAKPNKSIIKKLKKQVRRGKNVHIITARSDMDNQPEFASHLRRYGIEIDPQKNGKRHVHVHRAGNMEVNDIGKKKGQIIQGIMAQSGAKKAHMYDDAPKVHKEMEKINKQNPSGIKIKTHLVKPNKAGKVMSRSYQATKSEEFELWVEALLKEGYDLSEMTYDELYEGYEAIQDEPEDVSKSVRINYTSPYGKSKTELKEDTQELTPYEYWKSFIGEEDVDGDEQYNDELTEQTDIVIERTPTSYDYWKAKLQESSNS